MNTNNIMDIEESDLYSELPTLLKNDLPPLVQSQVVELILGRTSSYDNCKVILANLEVLASLLHWVYTSPNDTGRDACHALINISSYKDGCSALLSPSFEEACHKVCKKKLHIVSDSMKMMASTQTDMAELLCCLVNNLTRSSQSAVQVANVILGDDSLRSSFLTSVNEKLSRLEYMPFFYANLAQDNRIRKLLLDHNSNYFEVFPRLLKEDMSPVHHSGVVCLIKNCCFEYDEHEWLLGPEIDLLSYLLWPLAGPEEFDMDDMEKLPVGLQYLPKEKTREPKRAVRKMVLEALYKLCARKLTREILRTKNVYIILREYEKWEEDAELSYILSVVVNLLIQTEEEIGADFLPGLNIPEDIKTKFEDPSYDDENATSEEVQLIS